MMLYLSRLCLSREPTVTALRALLQPDDRARLLDADHRLVWSAFAADPDAPRDFVWRAEGNGVFHVLSRRPPQPGHFFEPPEIKPFAPALRAGDRLRFVLRANATRARPRAGRPSQRVDIVMDALFGLEQDDRAPARMPTARRESAAWLARQGERSGFSLSVDDGAEPDLTVSDYTVMALPGHVGRRKGQPQFGILDLSGGIVVSDPQRFVDAMAQGFGRAKAFGCGLMMIRRDSGA